MRCVSETSRRGHRNLNAVSLTSPLFGERACDRPADGARLERPPAGPGPGSQAATVPDAQPPRRDRAADDANRGHGHEPQQAPNIVAVVVSLAVRSRRPPGVRPGSGLPHVRAPSQSPGMSRSVRRPRPPGCPCRSSAQRPPMTQLAGPTDGTRAGVLRRVRPQRPAPACIVAVGWRPAFRSAALWRPLPTTTCCHLPAGRVGLRCPPESPDRRLLPGTVAPTPMRRLRHPCRQLRTASRDSGPGSLLAWQHTRDPALAGWSTPWHSLENIRIVQYTLPCST